MTRRDRQLLFGLAGLTLAVAALTLVGVHTSFAGTGSDILLALPALIFALPLLAGRYVGEERLARLAASFEAGRRRPSGSLPTTARRSSLAVPRGGRLLAASLAVRPPPAAPLIVG